MPVQKDTYTKRKYQAIQNFCIGHITKKPKYITFLEKRHSIQNQAGDIAKKQRRTTPKLYIPKTQDDPPTPTQAEQKIIKKRKSKLTPFNPYKKKEQKQVKTT